MKKAETIPYVINLEIKYGKSIGVNEYFAKDTVSDSMDQVFSRNRIEYDKKIGYIPIGRSSSCGWNRLNKVEFQDSSRISIDEITYEDNKFGIYKYRIQVKDTGVVPVLFYGKNVMLASKLHISGDTIYLEEKGKMKYKRLKMFLPLLWMIHLWPFWAYCYLQ
jgi:hypothetical protein